tara:strand:+ start:169 stop:549 length:381 start_codon:yes stop_codon:yes gene_type:complete
MITLPTIFTSISQNATNDSVICLPVKWARQAIIEIEERDYLVEENLVLEEEIDLMHQKLLYKDSILNSASSKENEYIETIESLKKSINLKEDQIALSEKKRRKAKFQRNLIGIASMVLTALTLITR